MKFHYKPKESIVQNIKNKQTGIIKRFVVCVFDAEGNYETEDPKIIHILQTKLPDCTWDSEETVEKTSVMDIMSDDEIRQLGKEKGIKSYHNKKIDKIKAELEVL